MPDLQSWNVSFVFLLGYNPQAISTTHIMSMGMNGLLNQYNTVYTYMYLSTRAWPTHKQPVLLTGLRVCWQEVRSLVVLTQLFTYFIITIAPVEPFDSKYISSWLLILSAQDSLSVVKSPYII